MVRRRKVPPQRANMLCDSMETRLLDIVRIIDISKRSQSAVIEFAIVEDESSFLIYHGMQSTKKTQCESHTFVFRLCSEFREDQTRFFFGDFYANFLNTFPISLTLYFGTNISLLSSRFGSTIFTDREIRDDFIIHGDFIIYYLGS